jgi:hypothetical protein
LGEWVGAAMAAMRSLSLLLFRAGLACVFSHGGACWTNETVYVDLATPLRSEKRINRSRYFSFTSSDALVAGAAGATSRPSIIERTRFCSRTSKT